MIQIKSVCLSIRCFYQLYFFPKCSFNYRHSTSGPWTSSLLICLFIRGRVCHLASQHSSYLWLHRRTPEAHPEWVRHQQISVLHCSAHTLHSSPSMNISTPPTPVGSLQENYTNDSLTWDFMAKRELEAPGAGEELQTAKGRASDINRREERCCQVYEEGVKSLNTGMSS